MQVLPDVPPEVVDVLVEDVPVELELLEVVLDVLVEPLEPLDKDPSSPPQAATAVKPPALARMASARRRPIRFSLKVFRSWARPRSWSWSSIAVSPHVAFRATGWEAVVADQFTTTSGARRLRWNFGPISGGFHPFDGTFASPVRQGSTLSSRRNIARDRGDEKVPLIAHGADDVTAALAFRKFAAQAGKLDIDGAIVVIAVLSA